MSVLDSNHNSNNNSDDDNDSNTKNRFLTRQSNTDKYIKLNTNDIENYVKKFYSNYLVDNYANELDILTTFIRGQKNLYAQSRIITQQKLTLLVFPALIIAACVTIISPFIECDSIDTNIITGLNAIITLFISLVGFLNLESSGEKYLILASLFDNIETNLELASTKLMVMKKEKDISELIVKKIFEENYKDGFYKMSLKNYLKFIQLKLPNLEIEKINNEIILFYNKTDFIGEEIKQLEIVLTRFLKCINYNYTLTNKIVTDLYNKINELRSGRVTWPIL